MQAEANAKGLLKPVGVLIVTRLIEQADALANEVNELAGRVVAVAYHSKRSAEANSEPFNPNALGRQQQHNGPDARYDSSSIRNEEPPV
jgi:hypothetical protein